MLQTFSLLNHLVSKWKWVEVRAQGYNLPSFGIISTSWEVLLTTCTYANHAPAHKKRAINEFICIITSQNEKSSMKAVQDADSTQTVYCTSKYSLFRVQLYWNEIQTNVQAFSKVHNQNGSLVQPSSQTNSSPYMGGKLHILISLTHTTIKKQHVLQLVFLSRERKMQAIIQKKIYSKYSHFILPCRNMKI